MDALLQRALRLSLGAVLAIGVAAAGAETPEDFARRVGKTKGASAVVNLRQDKSLGAIAIALAPQLVADRPGLEPLLAQIGEYAAAARMRATVVTPLAADGDYLVATLKAAGVSQIKTQAMADFVSIKTSRIFLSPAH